MNNEPAKPSDLIYTTENPEGLFDLEWVVKYAPHILLGDNIET